MNHQYKYKGETTKSVFIDFNEYKVSKDSPIITTKVKLTKEDLKRLGLEYKGDST